MGRSFVECDKENQEDIGDELAALMDGVSTQQPARFSQFHLRTGFVCCSMLGIAVVAVVQATRSIPMLHVVNAQNGLIDADDAPKQLPGIQYLNCGYNIFKANPYPSDGQNDPGFLCGVEIFDFKWSPDSGCDQYEVPEFVSCVPNGRCSKLMSTTEMSGETSYKNKLDAAVGLSASYTSPWSGAFSGSAGYRANVEKIRHGKKKLIVSTAQCMLNEATMNPIIQPDVSQTLEIAVKRLPSQYGDGSKYFDFIDQIGTHYLKSVSLGAQYGMTASISEEGQQALTGKKVDIQAGLSMDTGVVAASADGTLSTSDEAGTALMSSVKNVQVITVGGEPPSGSKDEWIAASGVRPMPITFKLASILNLIKDKKLAPHDHVLDNMEKAYTEYCLIHMGPVMHLSAEDCAGPSEDPECMWDSDCDLALPSTCSAGVCEFSDAAGGGVSLPGAVVSALPQG